jgi:hypothetical protein
MRPRIHDYASRAGTGHLALNLHATGAQKSERQYTENAADGFCEAHRILFYALSNRLKLASRMGLSTSAVFQNVPEPRRNTKNQNLAPRDFSIF